MDSGLATSSRPGMTSLICGATANTIPVIASAAKQSRVFPRRQSGLLRCARKDDGERSIMAKAAVAAGTATGQCLCGKITFEIDVPARWAWHDHSAASRRAHGAAYATYVGSWKKRFRITKGKAALTRYEDAATKTARSFCASCGTPIIYERARSPHMVT